jgi:ABC-type transport system substrate-binding protein
VRLVRASWLAAVVLLVAAPVGATGKVAAPARASGATLAAAPFAEAWANVPASPAARKAKNRVVFGIEADIPGFNGALKCCNVTGVAFTGWNEAIHGAFNQNNKGVWFKDLVTDAKATKTTLSYTIKPNAYWYWGGKKVPVTYKDFVYTLQKIDDPNSEVAGRVGYSNLDPTKFTHKGDKQVTFFWKTKDCSTDFPCGALAYWQPIFSSVYPSFALAGLDFNKIWTNCICGSDGKPVANGPFYLAKYTEGQGTTLKANPYWAGKKPRISEVDFKFILDQSAVAEAMRGGEVDAIVPRFDQALLPLKNTPGITFEQMPGYALEHLEFRQGKGSSNVLLRAPWMRQAIALGIDRQAIINTVYGRLAGNLTPMNNSIYYSTQEFYRPDFQRWSYDPGKALAIMKAHCTPGTGPPAPNPANTKIWQCSGLPATFNWTWRLDIEDWTRTEQLAKAELRSIGIQVIDRPLSKNVIFGPDGIPSGGFDIVQFAWITSGDPGDFYESWRCGGDGNFTGYCSHAVDAVLTEASIALDPAKRASLFQRADAILATDLPMLPLYQRPIVLIHRSDLLGMVPNPGIAGPFWNIEDWHWRA